MQDGGGSGQAGGGGSAGCDKTFTLHRLNVIRFCSNQFSCSIRLKEQGGSQPHVMTFS